MSKDMKPLIIIYTILILSGWIIGLKHQLNQSHEEKIEIMKIALENDRLNKEYISVLQESREALNDELDSQNLELEEYKYLEKFQKDLARHSN